MLRSSEEFEEWVAYSFECGCNAIEPMPFEEWLTYHYPKDTTDVRQLHKRDH